MSKAIIKFNKTIKRCEVLLDVYDNLCAEPSGPPPKDIIRATVVLAVAALDTYVTDVFGEKFIPYIKSYGVDDSLAKLLEVAGLDVKTALELINSERPYRKIRTLIENYYSRYTTQRFEVIDGLFLHYHLNHIIENSARKAGKISLARSVQILIERRHGIVHNGDYNRHYRINDISKEQVERRINDLEILVINMDEIIDNKIPYLP